MDHWTELRTALKVARLGTVSAAAGALGVHRATINRHIETLEVALGTPLFQRHARGYTLTDAGRDMLDVANRADEMFADLEGRNRGRAGQFSGNLVVTALAGVGPLLMPAIRSFHDAYPDIAIKFLAGAKLARLEYGEAHVAIRAGQKPQEPDYVVLPFQPVRFGLYASRDYIARAGLPKGKTFDGHSFVGPVAEAPWLPYARWMEKHVPPEAVALETHDQMVIQQGVAAGLGLGFLTEHDAHNQPDLVAVLPPGKTWRAPLWLVTHVDLRRTAKVQAFLSILKGELPKNEPV